MATEPSVKSEQIKAYVIIHGHFYQPPRENPWTQHIPQQESAAPYHDWNERITAQCYKPNTRSRALDERGQIFTLENNFAHINFNIGPTLFAWMQEHAPEVCQNIIEADRQSCQKHHGHGNAIAQVYNHVMIPLANTRDKITQIIWGLREFQRRFGRAAESIWLAETGINEETVNCLIEQGIKYVILSPTQAECVRKIGEEEWWDVSNNTIDTTQPYRLFKKEYMPRNGASAQNTANAEKNEEDAWPDDDADGDGVEERYLSDQFIDVFFYDGNLSSEISFNHLLRDVNVFAQRIQSLAASSTVSHPLIHMATDGEIYGHHEAFGDMSLAALLTKKLPSLQIEATNYGQYLAMFPPTMQVELKPGNNGEGTSWSCSHGVGRWYRDCGCAVDSPAGWNQKWRTPLREGFDRLRDALADVFEQQGRSLLRDPWAARNDYIECLLDPSENTIRAFLDRHASHPLNDEEQSLALRLLEAQKYSLFTYTSCAWFFNDVSGLEPVQNMRYAARALQLMDGLIAQDVEASMLEAFSRAISNMPQYGTGKTMYLNYVKPDVYTPERAVNQLLLTTLVHQKPSARTSAKHPLKRLNGRQEHAVHIYALRGLQVVSWQELAGQAAAASAEDAAAEEQRAPIVSSQWFSGVFEVKDTITRQMWRILFTTFSEDNDHPVAYLKHVSHNEEPEHFFAAVTQQMKEQANADSAAVVRLLEQWSFSRYTLNDFYHDDREQIFSNALNEYANHVEDHIETVYKESVELLDSLTKASLRVPARLQASVEFALTYHAMIEMERLYSKAVGEYSPAFLQAALEKVQRLSEAHRLSLDMPLLRKRLADALCQFIARLSRRFLELRRAGHHSLELKIWEDFLGLLRETFNLLKASEKIGVTVDQTEIQNMAYDIVEDTVPEYLALFKTALQNAGQTESESAHQELHRFFREYQFLRECLKLAQRLNFNIDHYRNVLISAELGVF